MDIQRRKHGKHGKAWTSIICPFICVFLGTFHEFAIRRTERGEPWLCHAANMSASLGNFARQALFSDGFSFSFMMPMYWLTRCLDSPVVRVMNSMSGM